LNSFEFECELKEHQQLKNQHETQKTVQALIKLMSNIERMFVQKTSERTKKKN